MPTDNLAAIDLGSNSCRLLITTQDGKTLYRDAISTKLGEGLSVSNLFSQQAIERGVSCFAEFAKKMQEFNVKKYRAVATAACRTAQNSDDFLRLVKNKSNIDIEIISPFEEARLNLNGALLNTLNLQKKYIVIYDIGGGSSEITLATNQKDTKIIHSISIPLGARNATEKFYLADYNAENVQRLAKEVHQYLQQFIVESKIDDYQDDICFLATSSTALRLAHLCKGWTAYDRERADGISVSVKDFDRAIDNIYQMDITQRRENLCIGANRAEIIIAACVIFSQIYRDLKAKEIITSLKGATEGIIMELQNASN